jgi:hypothetical protein
MPVVIPQKLRNLIGQLVGFSANAESLLTEVIELKRKYEVAKDQEGFADAFAELLLEPEYAHLSTAKLQALLEIDGKSLESFRAILSAISNRA